MKQTLLIHLLLCTLCISCINQPKIVNGSLPDGYQWAYGEWQMYDEGKKTSLFIGENYLQRDLAFISMAEGAMLPQRIVCYPKLEYQVETVSDYEINLLYEGEYGYESYVTLNKQSKRVEGYKRSRDKYDAEKAIAEYKERTEQSPFWGDWRNADDRTNNYILTLSPQEPSIISNDGKKLIQLSQGAYDLVSEDYITTLTLDDYGDAKKVTYVRVVPLLSEQDVYNYLTEHTFYNPFEELTVSFTSNLEMKLNGKVVSGKMNLVNLKRTQAVLTGASKLKNRSSLRIVLDTNQRGLIESGSRKPFLVEDERFNSDDLSIE